jgi:hypothetical protein
MEPKMDAATATKFKSSASTEWETAPAVFRALNRDFGPFTCDLTAREENAKCPVWLGPGSPFHKDALDVDDAPWDTWIGPGGVGYSNPPYGTFVKQILPIAHGAAQYLGTRTVFLLPLRLTKAFTTFAVSPLADVWLCTHRLVFWEAGAPRVNPRTGRPDVALFDSVVVTFGGTASGRIRTWDPPMFKEMMR